MNEQLEDIEDYLKNISEEQEKEFSTLKGRFEKMSKDSFLEAGEREKLCINSLLIIDAADTIKNVI